MTIKQKRFFDALIASSSYAEAARKAGYSESSCRVSASKNITKYNALVGDILDVAGVDADLLGQMLKKGLNSGDEKLKLQYLKFVLHLVEKIQILQEKSGLLFDI